MPNKINNSNNRKIFAKMPIFESGNPKIHIIVENKIVIIMTVNQSGLFVIIKKALKKNNKQIASQRQPIIFIPTVPASNFPYNSVVL